MAVLRLALDSSLAALTEATKVALSLGTLDPQAIALILRQRDATGAGHLDVTHRQPSPGLRAQVIDLEAYRITELAERAQ